jgi:hypothetical protein
MLLAKAPTALALVALEALKALAAVVVRATLHRESHQLTTYPCRKKGRSV